MPETLLRTKLFIPPLRPNLVPRPHLIARLDQGWQAGCKLTLISAPAGFGKSTLVCEWLQSLHEQSGKEGPLTAWISLDDGDNDPGRFLTYLASALNQAGERETAVGKGALAMLQSPSPPAAEVILTSLINEIASLSSKIILVLDDYHHIDSAAVDEAVTFLLENLPSQMHLLIATRDDPQLPLARLRARGHLTELRAIDLRFTSAEAAQFLNQVMGLTLSAAEIATLEDRTEGWIAGLQLAAVSLQGPNISPDLIESFSGSHRFVLDYLIEEVLEQQSERVQTFLLNTAVLERMTGSLCDAVTGQKNGRETLEMLDHANLFIIPLDEERHWYRYHHLFTDLLQQQLRQFQPEKIPFLHIKAGQWFKDQGLNREAIRHLLAAGDYVGASVVIMEAAIDIMQQGEHTAVIRWINALPDELVQEQPYLCVLHAWALQLTGQLETAEARLKDAEHALNSPNYRDDGHVVTIRSLIHSHRAYLTFMIGEHELTIYYARQALDQLPQNAALIRAQTALYLGVAYRYQGRLLDSLEVYNDILPMTQGLGGKSITVLHRLHLADLYWQLAQLHRAKEFCEQALNITEKHTGRPDWPFTGFAYVRIGRILRQWNQLQDAYSFTLKGLALCRDWNVADVLALSYIEMAHICQALGEKEQADASIQEALQIFEGFSPWGDKFGAAHRAEIDLQRCDVDAARNWAEANDLDIDGDFEFHRENEYLTLARLLIAQKRYGEAQALVERIFQLAQESSARHNELECLILLALLLSGQNDSDQALRHLEKALIIAEPEGYIRIFVDEGTPMASLLREALHQGIAPQYVSQLLPAFLGDKPAQAEKTTEQNDQFAYFEPLSDREVEVLQHIAAGLTNQEIANRLYLSLNTVKVHTRNIYSKLSVNSRTQAVARARALGILPHS